MPKSPSIQLVCSLPKLDVKLPHETLATVMSRLMVIVGTFQHCLNEYLFGLVLLGYKGLSTVHRSSSLDITTNTNQYIVISLTRSNCISRYNQY